MLLVKNQPVYSKPKYVLLGLKDACGRSRTCHRIQSEKHSSTRQHRDGPKRTASKDRETYHYYKARLGRLDKRGHDEVRGVDDPDVAPNGDCTRSEPIKDGTGNEVYMRLARVMVTENLTSRQCEIVVGALEGTGKMLEKLRDIDAKI